MSVPEDCQTIIRPRLFTCDACPSMKAIFGYNRKKSLFWDRLFRVSFNFTLCWVKAGITTCLMYVAKVGPFGRRRSSIHSYCFRTWNATALSCHIESMGGRILPSAFPHPRTVIWSHGHSQPSAIQLHELLSIRSDIRCFQPIYNHCCLGSNSFMGGWTIKPSVWSSSNNLILIPNLLKF